MKNEDPPGVWIIDYSLCYAVFTLILKQFQKGFVSHDIPIFQ